MADFSDEFIENVNILSSEEQFKILLEISHPNLSQNIRLINDNCDIVSEGETYIAFSFELNFFDDVENELTKCSIKVQNIGREMVKWVETAYGAKDAEVKIKMIRRVSPDNIEITLPGFVSRTVISAKEIDFDLIIAKNNYTQRGTRYVMDATRTPGIY